MYSDVVNRTQIYLTSDESELLDRESARTGASRSELIRRAIRAHYGKADEGSRRRALVESAGSWRDRRFTGEQYVDKIRGDLNERLARLGRK